MWNKQSNGSKSTENYWSRLYEQQVDEKVLSEFSYALIHLHSCGLHIVPAVLDLPGNYAVEISLDRESSSWDKEVVLEACDLIQHQGKSLLISGELDQDELDEFLGRLKSGGLAIFYWKPLEQRP